MYHLVRSSQKSSGKNFCQDAFGVDGNDRKWPDMSGNGWKWLEMAGNGDDNDDGDNNDMDNDTNADNDNYESNGMAF